MKFDFTTRNINRYFIILSILSRIFLRGVIPKVGVLTYYFANLFAENCMKMKEFGPPRGRTSLALPGSANAILFVVYESAIPVADPVAG